MPGPRTGPQPKLQGENHPRAILTATLVKEIRKLYEKGMHIKCIAILYGLKYSTTADAIHRRTWYHVKD